MLTDSELNHDPDYRQLIKAVIENGITDYVKLQHPLNRSKKYLEEGFLSSIRMFFDEDFRFQAFTSFKDDSPLCTKDLLSIMIGSNDASIQKAQDHVISESINYWWEKNFNDFKVPSKCVIAGKVWFVRNSDKLYINYDKNQIFLPVKSQGNDRLFTKACLEILLNEASIELQAEQFENFYKLFYLFLKVNDTFPKK